MRIKAVVHTVPESEGGGYWAEVPALPGCMTQGDNWDELLHHVHEAVEGSLLAGDTPDTAHEGAPVIELGV